MTNATISLEQALQKLEQQPLAILAGGTDFYPALQEGQPDSNVLDVTCIPSLKSIQRVDDSWVIGAGVTWSQLVAAELPPMFDALKCAAKDVGSIQIQNRGTVVGNICNASPAADGVPPLLILDAKVEIASAKGTRRVPLGSFIKGVRATDLLPGEMVTALVVPQTDAPVHQQPLTHFYKLGSRRYLVISIAMVAVKLNFDSEQRIASAAIAVGACSPVATRLPDLEKSLLGITTDADVDALVKNSHLAALSPIDDVRGSAAYRLDVVAEMIARSIKQLVGEHQALVST